MQDINDAHVSSKTGREWLTGLASIGNNANSAAGATNETVLIPDFTSGIADTSGQQPTPEILSEILADAADNELDYEETTEEPITNDLPEPTPDWSDQPDKKDTARQHPDPKKPETKSTDGSADFLVKAILERFPLDTPAVLMFVGSEKNIHVDETCAKVSTALAQKNIGKILLVDSDIDSCRLTQASGLLGQSGISDAVNKNLPWKTSIYGGAEINLEFLPSGAVPFDQKYAKDSLRRIVHEFKHEYQFICISAGDAHRKSAAAWSECCDGTYLLVSLNSTHETYAKSAVTPASDERGAPIGLCCD